MKRLRHSDTFHAPLSDSILKEYNALAKLVAPLTKTQRIAKEIEGTGGMVSVADIIAYQVGWANLLLTWYYAGIAGKIPIMPGEGFTTWDYVGLAQHFYTKYHYDASSKQDTVFCDIVQQIIEIVETEYHNGNLDRIGVWQWCTLKSGKQWPLSKWVRVNTVAPYKRAQKLIKDYIKK